MAAEPDRFLMPIPSDERYHWVRVRLATLDLAEMHELVTDAWRMVVPKRVAAEHLDGATGRRQDAPVSKPVINRSWHEAHRLGSHAPMGARIAWHSEHAAACGCRPIPPSVQAAIDTGLRRPR